MRGLSIGRLAGRAGVNLETVRYYERIGLIPEPARTAGGHRSYGADDARRLAFIRRARELGFAIEDVRQLLALEASDGRTCDQVRGIAAAHLASVQEKIADLRRLQRILAETIARCDDGRVPGCPVLDVLCE